MKPGKIIQIAMAHSQQACVEELFLDDNGVVWKWEHKTETEVLERKPNSVNDCCKVIDRYFSRLVPVEMSTEWEKTHERESYRFLAKEKNQ